jgi:hypothetical protein
VVHVQAPYVAVAFNDDVHDNDNAHVGCFEEGRHDETHTAKT